MNKPTRDLCAIEKEFWSTVRDNWDKVNTASELPVKLWGMHAWEQLSEKQISDLFLPHIQGQIARAKNHMPVYKEIYKNVDPTKITDLDSFYTLPPLVKDKSSFGPGFRHLVQENPYVMLPNDLQMAYLMFPSGGSKGAATPTFVTVRDRLIESTAFARGFRYEGMVPGQSMLSTYNSSHKGGEEIKEAALLNGMNFRQRGKESAETIIDWIEKYKINVLLTVQGPSSEDSAENKGANLQLKDLIAAGEKTLEDNIEVLFLGGYRLVDEAIQWSEDVGVPLVSLLGSSEAIPQATNTNFGPATRTCKHNNLHLLQGPHLVEIVKMESKALVPVKRGETGILAYTTVARTGTVYVRYFPGDKAKLLKGYGECECGLKSPVITDVMRVDSPDEILCGGCVSG